MIQALVGKPELTRRFFIPVTRLRYLHTPGNFLARTAIVQPTHVKSWRMKYKKSLKSQVSNLRFWHRLVKWPARPALIRQFGQAKLVKLPNGQHELVGGSDTDRAAAFEWSSLFAHEIVFTHFHRVELRPIRKSAFIPSISQCEQLFSNSFLGAVEGRAKVSGAS